MFCFCGSAIGINSNQIRNCHQIKLFGIKLSYFFVQSVTLRKSNGYYTRKRQFFRDSEFSSYEVEFRNRVTQNGVTI